MHAHARHACGSSGGEKHITSTRPCIAGHTSTGYARDYPRLQVGTGVNVPELRHGESLFCRYDGVSRKGLMEGCRHAYRRSRKQKSQPVAQKPYANSHTLLQSRSTRRFGFNSDGQNEPGSRTKRVLSHRLRSRFPLSRARRATSLRPSYHGAYFT